MTHTPTAPPLTGKLLIETELGSFLGEKRIRLLEAIDRHGSILQAAKAVPMAYKAAWDAVDDMNNVAPEPLVHRATGGRNGGGSGLTAFGRRLIAFYRALEIESQTALARLSERLAQGGETEVADFRHLLRKIHMKTSARNQFAGPISALRMGPVDCEVVIRLDPQLELTAIVTPDSALNLGLAEGQEVLAFVKASSIVLLVDEGHEARISARNRFTGTVAHIETGPVNSELTIDLPGGRHVLTAVITEGSVQRLGLVIGTTVTAIFKASSVFLVATD